MQTSPTPVPTKRKQTNKDIPQTGPGTLTRKVVTVVMGLALWTAPSPMRPSDRLGPASCGIFTRIPHTKGEGKRKAFKYTENAKIKTKTNIPETKTNQPNKKLYF